jgi:hypothetical protein
MNPIRTPRTFQTALLAAVVGSVALVGCKKKEEPKVEPAPAPVATAPAPAPAPAPVAATASVASVDLGSAVGADGKLSAMVTSFKPNDKFVVSIGTNTSDPAATVAGKLDAKLSYMDGTTVTEVKNESRDFNFAGMGNTNVEFVKPDGWPLGKYKVEVSLNGALVQTKEFEVVK